MNAWTTEANALNAMGVTAEVFDTLQQELGDLTSWVQLALFPASLIRGAVAEARLEPDDPGERPLSPLEAAQVGSLWRLARRKVGSNFDDPFEDLAPAAQTAPPGSLPPAGASSLGNRKLKTSHFCDQADDTEVLRAEPPTVAKWYSNYSRIMHGDPPEDISLRSSSCSLRSSSCSLAGGSR